MKGTQLGVGLVGWGIAAFGLVACGSVPAPHEREASSQAAIRTATEMNAQQVPQAALHLKLAQEQFEKGKAFMNDGDNERATYALLRAQADAELALALARENKTRTEAQVLIDKLRAARGPAPTSAMEQPSGQ
ncbi:MAG TPA: DUF4398 domain-containing protein [Polyangiaceae bacterium]|nr:DUF4398 domain-containing protein [Polyangiaceae bacterium]